jgi:hypothetical protein
MWLIVARYTPGWTFTRCGEGFEKTLLVEFDRVIDAFLDLKPEYQAVIQDITARMGEGKQKNADCIFCFVFFFLNY